MVEKEQTVVVDGNQPDEEVKTQPTIEELQKQLEERDKEIERKEGVLQTTKRELRETRQKGGSKVELEALGKKIESQEEWIASALDDIANRVGGDYEEPKQVKQTYAQQLKERRQAKPEEPKPDPDTEDFLSVCKAMDLHIDSDSIDDCDPLVKEALAEDRSFKQATKYLKDKMKPKDIDVDKLVDEKVQNGLRVALEQEFVKRGWTAPGVGSPSGTGGGTDEAFLKEYSEGISDDHDRAKKILNKMK